MADPVQVTVREGTPDDAPAIAALLAALMVDHGLAPLSPERLVGAVEHVMQLPAAWYLVADGEGELVGTLQLNQRYSTWETAPYGYVEDFCVAPARRGEGIGRLLLAQVERWARERGWVRVDLDVSTSLTGTLRFYERCGYRNTGSVLYRRELPRE
jgi:GNAT superfamily N-acetyltransferase